MSACRTWGPRVSVQFLFWHPFLITHINDWSPGLGRRSGDGSLRYTMALPLLPSSGRSLRCRGRVEPDICNGPRAVRLSSEHPAFGPKTLPIGGPWGASCAGAARYLWPFVWSNPSQLKPPLTPASLSWLRHLGARAAESRTQPLFCEMWLG